jgi:hypothetical protein
MKQEPKLRSAPIQAAEEVAGLGMGPAGAESLIPENIPSELKELHQWVCWKEEESKEGKNTKVPKNAHTGFNAKSNDSKTWAAFDKAVKRFSTKGYNGLMFALTEADSFTVVDLDDVRDPETEKIEPWAEGIISRLNSYTEISPSGRGVHIWVKGKLPSGGRRTGKVEMYDSHRFMAVTGHHLEGTPTTIEERQTELSDLHAWQFGGNKSKGRYPKLGVVPPPTCSLTLSDEELLEKARKRSDEAMFDRLWQGEWEGDYPSQSEGDLALCRLLACETKDPGQIDRIFRQSKLIRTKWDEKHSADGYTYGQMTIDKAIASSELVGTPYCIQEGQLCHLKPVTKGGKTTHITLPLCNFVARCEEEITKDDGREIQKEFVLNGTLDNGQDLPTAAVKASEFPSMKWVSNCWGMAANISAGYSKRDQLREAIQHLSRGTKQRIIYAHTGWREINGVWVYLHGGGGIGIPPGVQVEVDLGPDLERYCLPGPGGAKEVQASLDMLGVADFETMAPLLACVYLAPLADLLKVGFTLWLLGPTGSLKSTLAALALSHFGQFDLTTLPGRWASTENALERLAFVLKDSMFVIDDYAPPHNTDMERELRNSAHRIIRAAGNRAGRQRLTSDLSEQKTFDPRCLLVSTGEILPNVGQSVAARFLVVPVERQRINLELLTDAQKKAHLYPAAMSAYLSWLAPQLEKRIERARQKWEAFREEASGETHLRVPEMVAWLGVGFDLLLDFHFAMGVVDQERATELRQEAWQAFKALGDSHHTVVEDERPTRRFLSILKELFSQKKVYLESLDGGSPPEYEEWGWRPPTGGFGNRDPETSPYAQLIGWVDTDYLYLMPDATWAEANKVLKAQGISLGLTKDGFSEALAKEGFTLTDKNRNTKQKKIRGGNHRVWFMDRQKFNEALDG